MLKKFFTIVLALVFFACKGPVPEPQPQGPSQDPSGEVSPDPSGLEGSEDPQSEDPSAEPESVDPNYIAPTDTVREKPMVMWIDASANFRRFEKQSDIKATLKKARKAGFNGIVVGVKPGMGTALYESEFLKPCTTLAGYTINRDWDYLEFILREAKALGMRVEASASVMVMGEEEGHTGAIFEDPYFAELECVEWLPSGLHKISENPDNFAAINPCHPNTIAYLKRMITEMFSNPKYAALDGFCLDYCRYMNANSDFSDYSRKCFEQYIGQEVENWPSDIYYYTSPDKAAGDYTPGKLYNQWMEWRASVIKHCVQEAREALKAVRPDADLSVWAAAWYPLPATGQNWGSTKYTSVDNMWWATKNYHNTGYAADLDYFQLGAYYNKVSGFGSADTIEYAISNSRNILKGDCPLWGTFSVASSSFKVTTATKLCLTKTEGCMVFDLVHIGIYQYWDKIKAGVDEAWAELGVNSPLKVKQFPKEESNP
ncbi:MAG: family 10 glycosylhydrolase [Bacteroidales bacterium]|nr:family 10 glycosylhydrolase [Bacteroidales bacterium]